MAVFTVILALGLSADAQQDVVRAPSTSVPSHTGSAMAPSSSQGQPNIIFVLTDDQRFDAIGALNPYLSTPNMDLMIQDGAHFENAVVTTALCSPSRASILTGQYMHTHGVVDNNKTRINHLEFFPERLQAAGYQTGFVGKWHMGEADPSPQPGFDRWVSFRGQGNYLPVMGGRQSMLNVDGKAVPQTEYITDELTDYGLKILDGFDADRPFMLYLSHKAVHAEFIPAERHSEQYAGALPELPASAADTPENRRGKPRWVQDQRNSWHGIDFPYHSDLDVRKYYRDYARSLSAVDDSLGRLFAWLDENGLTQDTIVILMSDNGFMFGEHGLIDKRNAYEESLRVPLLMRAPGRIAAGTNIAEVVANIDIAPTLLDWAGAEIPDHYEGRSLTPLLKADAGTDGVSGSLQKWRDSILYEYFWEYDFPHTPTTFAVRTQRYKLIQYHGVWDTEELYDLVEDPKEMTNLIDDSNHVAVKVRLRAALFDMLANPEGEHLIRYTERMNTGAILRHRDRSVASEFPDHWLRRSDSPDKFQHHGPDSLKKLERYGTLTHPKPRDEP